MIKVEQKVIGSALGIPITGAGGSMQKPPEHLVRLKLFV